MSPKTANLSKAKWLKKMKNNYCQLWLTCAGEKEAGKIANTLLVKQLVACAHQIPVNSNFRWQGKIDSSEEVLLIMDSRQDLFDEVEREVAKLHSYDCFVLKVVPITDVSKNAKSWIINELRP